jgi:hypothetical protein
MEKLLTTLAIILITATAIYAGNKLNNHAAYLKDHFSTDYELTIRANAVEKWTENHSMIVHEINQQSKALFSVSKLIKDHPDIFVTALEKWSTEGYSLSNMELIIEHKSSRVWVLIKMSVNWNMVHWTMKEQIEAEGAY